VAFPSNLHLELNYQIGYFNIIMRGFQHRDISVGNVLCVDRFQETMSVFESLAEKDCLLHGYQMRLKTQLQQSGVENRCNGFVIDGDMAIKLKSYFMEEHAGSRSVRCSLITLDDD
jgi:hypothetical protein